MTDDSLIGAVLSDRYRIDSLLGEGAMGRVFSAEHVLMRKRVAVKVLHKELTAVPEAMVRFEREAMAAAHIDHPHVASATDFGHLDDGSVFLVLEYVEGRALSELIAEGPIPVGRALGIAEQIASALEAAHSRNIVHRDLKPDNIHLVRRDQQTDFAKVLDFGIAKVPAEGSGEGKAITQVGMVYGTPEYMAPEQALGQEVDGRADVYALGVILYEMLAGQRPYSGPAVGLLGQQLSKPLPALAERNPNIRIAVQVEEFVRSLLIPNAEERVGSATEVVDRLRVLATHIAGAPAGADAARGSMLSSHLDDVGGRLQMVTQKLPEPLHKAVGSRRSRGLVVALVFGVLGVAGAIFAAGWWLRVQPPETTLSPPERIEVADSPPDLSADVEVAKEKGVDALRFLVEKYPAEPSVRAALANSLAKEKEYVESVSVAREALELDPKLNESKVIAGALYRAAQSRKASPAAFRLLEGAMGSAGADIIYDLSITSRVRPWVKKQCRDFLKSDSARSVASPALLLLLDLEQAANCETAAALVKRAALVGDKRVLPHLVKMRNVSGCGASGHQDCYPCLRGDETLDLAISTLEKRAILVDGNGDKPSEP